MFKLVRSLSLSAFFVSGMCGRRWMCRERKGQESERRSIFEIKSRSHRDKGRRERRGIHMRDRVN